MPIKLPLSSCDLLMSLGTPKHKNEFARALLCWLLALMCFLGSAVAQTPVAADQLRQATEALHQGRLEEAAEGFASVTKSSPQFAEGHFNLGLVREEQGRNEEAITSLQKALVLKPRLRGA